MFGRRKKKRRSLADVDIDRNEGMLYLVREYKLNGEDRTVAVYVSEGSARRALGLIKDNMKRKNTNTYEIETLHYVEHKNSLVAK